VYELDRTYYNHIIDNELLENAQYKPTTTDDEHGVKAKVADGEKVIDELKTSDEEAMSDEESEESDEEEMSDDELEESDGEKMSYDEDQQMTPGPVVTSSITPPENDTRDHIVPYEFVRNIMLNNRFVVESILDMGLQVLMVSYKCLLYKHMVHLNYLIRVQMRRSDNQKKAASWSEKSIEVTKFIFKTMGALQFTDKYLLAMLSLFDTNTKKGITMESDVKHSLTRLENISKGMLEFIKKNCAVIPKSNKSKTMEEQVAEMIGVYKTSDAYKTAMLYTDTTIFKDMITDGWEKILSVFNNTPQINGMSMSTWNDIIKYHETFKQQQQLYKINL